MIVSHVRSVLKVMISRTCSLYVDSCYLNALRCRSERSSTLFSGVKDYKISPLIRQVLLGVVHINADCEGFSDLSCRLECIIIPVSA